MFTGRRFAEHASSRPAPARTMRPSSGVSKPAIIRSVVVLPQPLGPSSEKNSPSRIASVTSSHGQRALPKRLLTPSSAIAALRSSGMASDLWSVSLEQDFVRLDGDAAHVAGDPRRVHALRRPGGADLPEQRVDPCVVGLELDDSDVLGYGSPPSPGPSVEEPSQTRDRMRAAIRSASRGSTASSGGGRRTKPLTSSRSSAWSGVSGASTARRWSDRGTPGLDLDPRASSRRERANGADCTAGDEERLPPTRLDRRSDQADLQAAQPFEPAEAVDDVLERLDAIPQPGSLLEAEALGQVRQTCSEAGQRPSQEEAFELFVRLAESARAARDARR